MAALLEQILALHKQLPGVKSAHAKTIGQRQLDATDHQINQLVSATGRFQIATSALRPPRNDG